MRRKIVCILITDIGTMVLQFLSNQNLDLIYPNYCKPTFNFGVIFCKQKYSKTIKKKCVNYSFLTT